MGAAALCLGQSIPLTHIKKGLEALAGVPGRFELIENAAGLNVIVDYAHTPAGLENILHTARALLAGGRLILVFGAGGDRDRAKRPPLMGAVAGRLADVAIITSDNPPRSEDPADICSHIETGLLTINSPAEHLIILRRRAAIKKKRSVWPVLRILLSWRVKGTKHIRNPPTGGFISTTGKRSGPPLRS